MNSSGDANRSNRGQSSDRGRGRGRGQGHSRGGFNNRNNSGPSNQSVSVPTIQQVVIDAPVSIILKVDQPTGRQVQGIVAELLTRGNHPRGIKVRLRDGRVGRVQRMANQAEGEAGSAGMSGLGRNGEVNGEINGGVQLSSGTGGGFPTQEYGDFRVDAPDEPTSAGLSLADYVVVKSRKRGQQKQATETPLDGARDGGAEENEDSTNQTVFKSATSTCPVCGEFEGDEDAVAHHVNSHFD